MKFSIFGKITVCIIWRLHRFLYIRPTGVFVIFWADAGKNQKLDRSKSFTRSKLFFLVCNHCVYVTYTPCESIVTLRKLCETRVSKMWIFGFWGNVLLERLGSSWMPIHQTCLGICGILDRR